MRTERCRLSRSGGLPTPKLHANQHCSVPQDASASKFFASLAIGSINHHPNLKLGQWGPECPVYFKTDRESFIPRSPGIGHVRSNPEHGIVSISTPYSTHERVKHRELRLNLREARRFYFCLIGRILMSACFEIPRRDGFLPQIGEFWNHPRHNLENHGRPLLRCKCPDMLKRLPKLFRR